MEKTVKICAIQMCAIIGDKLKNYDKIKYLSDKIKNSDVIVLPEVWNIGWNCKIFKEQGEDLRHSPTLDFLKEL